MGKKENISKFDWSKVIGERCECGHLKTEHKDIYPIPDRHGNGGCKKCNCKKYTWKEFVLKP